jgi:DNA repair ATPase RecN
MSKSQITRIELENALKRILSGKTERIAPNRKISVKAVEEEAGLGDGSAYYYKDIVSTIKETAINNSPKARNQNLYEEKIANLRERLANEKRLKEKYYKQVEDYKEQLSEMASQHNQLALMIQQYQYQIAALKSPSIQDIN